MIDADTIKILEHMLKKYPELDPDIAYHSVEHDVIQSETAQPLARRCRSKSLYKKYHGVDIMEEDADGSLVRVHYKNLQGHPKVVSRRKRNAERGASTYRMARKHTPVVAGSRMIDGSKNESTKHWFERVA